MAMLWSRRETFETKPKMGCKSSDVHGGATMSMHAPSGLKNRPSFAILFVEKSLKTQ